MGEFITITIDQSKCGDIEQVNAWVKVCPVNIFEVEDGVPVIVKENEDECTLCDLCLEACKTGAVAIEKRY